MYSQRTKKAERVRSRESFSPQPTLPLSLPPPLHWPPVLSRFFSRAHRSDKTEAMFCVNKDAQNVVTKATLYVNSVITWWQQIKARNASAAGCSRSMSNDWRRSMSNRVWKRKTKYCNVKNNYKQLDFLKVVQFSLNLIYLSFERRRHLSLLSTAFPPQLVAKSNKQPEQSFNSPVLVLSLSHVPLRDRNFQPDLTLSCTLYKAVFI